MLALRPTCEHCNVALDPAADNARFCTYECTFCADCATWELLGVCPNCGGELVTRPRRPAAGLIANPASLDIVHKAADLEAHRSRVERRLHEGNLPAQVWNVAFCSGRVAGQGTRR